MAQGGYRKGAGRKNVKEQLVIDLYRTKWNNKDLTLRDILYRMYVEEGKSQRQIAKELYMSASYVGKLLIREGVPRKKLKWTFEW